MRGMEQVYIHSSVIYRDNQVGIYIGQLVDKFLTQSNNRPRAFERFEETDCPAPR